MAITEITQDIHPDTIICQTCGHDCAGISDCGDICICVEEFDELGTDADAVIDYAEHDYWDRYLASGGEDYY